MAKTLNELWRDVTGLVWDLESMLKNMDEDQKAKLTWYIPDGSVLSGHNQKSADTKALLEELGFELETKFSEAEIAYNEEYWGDDTGSSE